MDLEVEYQHDKGQDMSDDSSDSGTSSSEKTSESISDDIKFYTKSSWYLLVFVVVIELIIMFIMSNISLADQSWIPYFNANLIPWIVRLVVFTYVLWKIGKRFWHFNLMLFGAVLGYEVGLVVSLVKIVVQKAAIAAWINLLVEPILILFLGALIGAGFTFWHRKKQS